LNDVVKLTSKESGGRDRKVLKLRQFLVDTVSTKTSSKLTSSSSTNSSDSFDLVNFNLPIPLISDPDVRINGTNIEKTTMFKSNLMPCKFCFKTTTNQNNKQQVPLPFNEYSVIYKIGDDLRQDQLVLQMIALMDKLLKQENLDLKLTPYKVVATGIKEGFLQFIDAVPVSTILSNEYRTIKEYLRKHNPSETEKYGITSEAMDNYVRSIGELILLFWIEKNYIFIYFYNILNFKSWLHGHNIHLGYR
jgi:phosphatidylinositol 3-kinase